FRGFTLARKVRLTNAGTEDARVEAFVLEVAAAPSPDGGYFRLVPTKLAVIHPRCKLRSGDATVDVEVRIRFDSFWTDDKGVTKQHTAEPPPLIIKDMPLGREGER